jgi:catechol 2,3-dioxygenase-like lactoylglutathione lyase family enzyme
MATKPRVIGFNHVALEVGDIDEALAFYGRIFDFQLRGKSTTMAFIDLGDQFIALQSGRKQPPMMGVMSASWSMIKKWRAPHSRQRGSN